MSNYHQNTFLYQSKNTILLWRSGIAFAGIACLIVISAWFIHTGLELQRDMLKLTRAAFQQQLQLRNIGDRISFLISSAPRPDMTESVIIDIKDYIRETKHQINNNHAELKAVYSVERSIVAHWLLVNLVGDHLPQLTSLDGPLNELNIRVDSILNSDTAVLRTGTSFWNPMDLMVLREGKITLEMEQLVSDVYYGSANQNKMLTLLYGTLLVVMLLGLSGIWYVTFRPLALRLKEQDDKILQAHNELYQQLFTDVLTGLRNRAAFNQEVAAYLSDQSRISDGFGLLLMDIDGFKSVNDNLGHDIGDQVLIEVAQRLRCLEDENTLPFRLAGDEFVFIKYGSHDHIRSSAEQLGQRVCEKLYQPYKADGQNIQLSVSIGIVWQSRKKQGVQSKELMRAADIALSQVKQQGRNNYLFFDQVSHLKTEDLRNTEAELNSAVANNEIKPFYQPIVDVESGAVLYLEALARWDSQQKGLLLPEKWMDIADQALLSRITEKVFDQVEKDIEFLGRESGLDNICVNINVTESMLVRGTVLSIAKRVINKFGMPARIGVEITESVVFDRSYKTIKEQLDQLHQLGVKIFLDDFGTGYASFIHLKDFPVDAIKMDKSFALQMRGGSSKEIVAAMFSLADSLGKQLICEGIEDETILEILQGMGCRYGQGYLFSRPVPRQELLTLLRAPLLIDVPSLNDQKSRLPR